MVSTAQPHFSLRNRPVTLRYNATRRDGDRVEVTVGDEIAQFKLYDWELKPLATFVDSGNHGTVHIRMMWEREEVSLDAAFRNGLLGLRFIQADLMPRNIILSQKYLPRDKHGLILGAGEEERLGTDQSVAQAVADLAPLMAKTQSASNCVLTDAKKPFIFWLENGQLTVMGTPYFFFWDEGPDDTVVPRQKLNVDFKKAWRKLKQANPVVIEAMERSFRAAAFFRYESENEKMSWNDFMAEVRTIEVPRVPTPDFLSQTN